MLFYYVYLKSYYKFLMHRWAIERGAGCGFDKWPRKFEFMNILLTKNVHNMKLIVFLETTHVNVFVWHLDNSITQQLLKQ